MYDTAIEILQDELACLLNTIGNAGLDEEEQQMYKDMAIEVELAIKKLKGE